MPTLRGSAGSCLKDRLCRDSTCDAVVGNVLVYLDDNHLTWVYVKTMATDLEQRILAATKWSR